jgi:zinc protease
VLVETMEGVAETEITEEEVQRAQRQILNNWEQSMANSSQLAVQLSNWASQGDWRLFFLYRDRVEKVTAEDVKEVAARYLRSSNRTFGVYIPTETAQRVEIPESPNVTALLADYEGREAIAAGEQFDATPANIEARTERGALPSGISYALLPKQTRGQTVHLRLTLRYGNAENLREYRGAAALLPTVMTRGTRQLTHQQIQDQLDLNNATLDANGQRGFMTFTIRTKRDNLPAVLSLLKQILREPSLSAEQLELHRAERLASLEQLLNDPRALASNELRRILSPYPDNDIRYVPPLDGQVELIRTATREQLVQLYDQFVDGQNGQLSIVGDFSSEQIKPQLAEMFDGWTATMPYERIG